MKNDTYGYTDRQKELVNNIYPTNPHDLDGEHTEMAIVIQQPNSDGTLISLRNNTVDGNEVFSYDVVAVKHLMHKISEEISLSAAEGGVHLSPEQIEKKWNEIHDNDTTLTVHKHLAPAVKLVQEGKVYSVYMNNGEIICKK